MERFQQKFVEEATEHIHTMEESLLLLEQSPDDIKLIEQTFRSMHTLKGGGAMFGFQKISSLMHNLESIFDQIRSKKTVLSSQLIELSLRSVDQLKSLLQQGDHETNNEEYNLLLGEINNFSQTGTVCQSTTPAAVTFKETAYYLCFIPHGGILKNGTNPLFILDELCSLGQAKVIARYNNVPFLKEIIPEHCYMWWEIILSTNKPMDALREVFLFVEEQCTIEIVPLGNSINLRDPHVKQFIEEKVSNTEKICINELESVFSDQSLLSASPANGNGNGYVNEPPDINHRNNDIKIASIRVESKKIDQFMNYVSELVTTQQRLNLFLERNSDGELMQIAENIQKLTRELRDLAFTVALIPIDHALIRFQRLVRDLSRDLNKEVDFVTEGTDTELDKNIIESLTDPILHILRNCLDHGIEHAARRVEMGKPAKGKITLRAYYTGANVFIQINDDGCGIDPARLRQKALEKNLITPNQSLTDSELIDLIFLPGFSTSANVTSISGRGVGMDVVRRKIAEIRGSVEVESEVNKGTTITIKLPITLSIVDGILVLIGDVKYLIPLSSVEKIYPIRHRDIEGCFHNLFVLNGEQIPFFYLRSEFGISNDVLESEYAVVVRYNEKKVALIIDQVIGEYQAVLKPLGMHYKGQEMISGGTILGDGTVALVLDTNRVIINCIKNLTLA